METDRVLWDVELLGGLRASLREREMPRFPTRKIAGLFAYLAAHPGRAHARDDLIDILWPDAEIEAGRDRLSQALVWLRGRLEPEGARRGSVLHADRYTVRLVPEAIRTDVTAFEAAVQAAGSPGSPPDTPQHTLALLRDAVGHYRGDLLPGFVDDWVLTRRRHLQDLYQAALHRLVHGYDAIGDRAPALEFARRAVRADSSREEAHCDLIRLLFEAGDVAPALRQIREMEHTLAQDPDAPLSPAARSLISRVRAAAVPETAPDGAPPSITQSTKPSPAVPAARRTAPPAALNRFFGRDEEIRTIRQALAAGGDTRLLVLIGPGGAGKTRLALEIARRLDALDSGSVIYVPLADVRDEAGIPSAIASALRLPQAPHGPSAEERQERVVDALRTLSPCLVVLDNLEHLLPDAAGRVRTLLERVPTLTILATSRRRLGIEGEREQPVPPLGLPAGGASDEDGVQAASVQLFVDRARAVRPSFTVTPENAQDIVAVCRRLEGLPLAIELCAAWAQTLTPAQMLERLERRFDLLVSRRSDIPPRHRSLRAALEHSYLQLPAELRRLFLGLSIFRGGWTLEAAEATCRPPDSHAPLSVLAGLTELRERSLIVADEVAPGAEGREMRYHILETLREFAEEQLVYGDRAAARRLHAEYFSGLAERAETGIAGPEPQRWLERLDREMENLRSALAWSLESGEIATGLRLGSNLARYWSIRGPIREGHEWMRTLLDAATAGTGQTDREASPAAAAAPALTATILARAWSVAGHLAWLQGDYAEAEDAHRRALALRRDGGDTPGVAESLYHLGITAYRRDDFAAAEALLDESLQISQERRDPAGIARVLLNLGNVAYERRHYDDARRLFQESLRIEEELGGRRRIGDVLNNLGLVAIACRDFRGAAALFERALAIRREQTDLFGAATVLANLGTTARLESRPEEAGAALREGLSLAYAVGDRHILAHLLLQLGLLHAAEGDAEPAVRLITAAQRQFQAMGTWSGMPDPAEVEGCLDQARLALGNGSFDDLRRRGAMDDMATILDFAGVPTLDQTARSAAGTK